jgi:hypothetical protein
LNGACNTHTHTHTHTHARGGGEECKHSFCHEKQKKDYVEDKGKDVNIRLKCIFKELMCGRVNWIHLAQDRGYSWML